MLNHSKPSLKPLLTAITGILLLSAQPTLLLAADSLVGEEDTIADAVLGQLDLNHSSHYLVDGYGLNLADWETGDVAIDKSVTPNRVFVTDTANNRVLGWSDIKAFQTHASADIVIGQPNFAENTANNGGVSAASLNGPSGVAVDNAGNLYVADTGNHRVLYYRLPFKSNKLADEVFGQGGSFTSHAENNGGVTENSLSSPTGLTVDKTGNLYVADSNNNRVLEFHSPLRTTQLTGSGDTSADRVFGQLGVFTSNSANAFGVTADSLYYPNDVAVDIQNNVYIVDSFNNRVLKYKKPLVTDTTADNVYGQDKLFTTVECNKGGISKRSLCYPWSVAVDTNGDVYISDRNNQRVLGYAKGKARADSVLGQPNFIRHEDGTSRKTLNGPSGLALDDASGGANLYVSDAYNNRVLQYQPSQDEVTKEWSFKRWQPASGVLGQYLFKTDYKNDFNSRVFSFSEYDDSGSIAIDTSVTPSRVYVADTANHRVLGYKSIAAFTSQAKADLVIGQPNAYSIEANYGGLSNKSLNYPRAVSVDKHGNLFVVDHGNSRVLAFNTPFTTDTTADVVLGQSGSFTTNSCNQNGISAESLCYPAGITVDSNNNVYVADFNNHRVLKYSDPLTTNVVADAVYGQGGSYTSSLCNFDGDADLASQNSFCHPLGLTVDAQDRLYVADWANNRVLAFPKDTTSASHVFGQPDLTTKACSTTSADSLCHPRSVAVNSQNDVFVSDHANNRVLKYNTPLTTDRRADQVFGQNSQFDTGSCLEPVSASTLCGPDTLVVDENDNLYVIDSQHNRILQYLRP